MNVVLNPFHKIMFYCSADNCEKRIWEGHVFWPSRFPGTAFFACLLMHFTSIFLPPSCLYLVCSCLLVSLFSFVINTEMQVGENAIFMVFPTSANLNHIETRVPDFLSSLTTNPRKHEGLPSRATIAMKSVVYLRAWPSLVLWLYFASSVSSCKWVYFHLIEYLSRRIGFASGRFSVTS